MIDGVSARAMSAMSFEQQAQPSAQTQRSSQVNQPQNDLPSVGHGRELQWAQSWSQLSDRMRNMTTQVNQVVNHQKVNSQTVEGSIASMGEMLKFSQYQTQTTMQFQLATGMVSNAATSINKLLTQQ